MAPPTILANVLKKKLILFYLESTCNIGMFNNLLELKDGRILFAYNEKQWHVYGAVTSWRYGQRSLNVLVVHFERSWMRMVCDERVSNARDSQNVYKRPSKIPMKNITVWTCQWRATNDLRKLDEHVGTSTKR